MPDTGVTAEARGADGYSLSNIRVLPSVLGLTYSKPRNSATPGS
jgi:hypothetical protein